MGKAIYVRVSSRTQNERSQLPDLKAWEARQDGETVAWYRDTFTGRTMSRPGFDRLMEAVRLGKVDTVVVWRLDRLGRTCAGLNTLIEEFVTRGTNLVSLKDGIDLGTAAGKMLANVLSAVAAFETEIRSERQMAGIAASRAAGVKFGRKPGTGKPLKVTPEKREMVLRLKAEGAKIAAIARIVSLCRDTVYEILKPART